MSEQPIPNIVRIREALSRFPIYRQPEPTPSAVEHSALRIGRRGRRGKIVNFLADALEVIRPELHSYSCTLTFHATMDQLNLPSVYYWVFDIKGAVSAGTGVALTITFDQYDGANIASRSFAASSVPVLEPTLDSAVTMFTDFIVLTAASLRPK